MDNAELLQAIGTMMDNKLKSIQEDISGIKADVSGLKSGQEALQEQVTKINIELENEIGKKLSALFDGHQLDTEKMDFIKDSVENIETTLEVTDIVSKANTQAIRKLKEKLG